MEEYQQRVMDEKKQLDEKLIRLNIFLDSPKATNLIKEEYIMLLEQSIIMKMYSRILSKRIELFK